MTTDPKSIAEGLSEAQRDAVCGRFSFSSPVEQEMGEARLFELGLWSRENMKRRRPAITPLGLAVRKHLRDAG